MPCTLKQIITFLLGMLAGWILVYAFLAWHGVDLANHDGEWHIVIDSDNEFAHSVPDQRGGIHQVLHCFFWHSDDGFCE